jgi:hypothetical protein
MATQRFYLGGGTALAIHLGHRRSVDFDWFTRERIADPLHLARDLNNQDIAFVTGNIERGTLHGSVSGVQVSFLEYRYPLLQPLVAWPMFGCTLASPEDLACMKLSALAQRGAKKDFVDIYALGIKYCSLSDMLGWYQQKYAVTDLTHVLYSQPTSMTLIKSVCQGCSGIATGERSKKPLSNGYRGWVHLLLQGQNNPEI